MVLASVLFWLAASAPPARAASGVSCTYDGTNVAITLTGSEDGWGYYGTLNLARTAEGAVSVAELEDPWGEPLGPGVAVICTGGQGADLASAVSIVASGEGVSLTLNVLIANWTPGTSIAIDGSVQYLYLGLVGTDGPDVIHTSNLAFDITYPWALYARLHGLGGPDDLALEAGGDLAQLTSGGIEGGDGDDLMIATLEQGAGLFGGSGNDFMKSSSSADDGAYLSGGDGDDLLTGGDAPDSLAGDAGDDQLDGGDGADYLYGGDGDDLIDGGAGDDDIEGDAGDDVIDGSSGDDYIDGDPPEWSWGEETAPPSGNDTIDGGAGSDALSGAGGDDTIRGGDGDDYWLEGGPGDDLLDGGPGSESLSGDDGNDTLVGGPDDDYWLDGGSGDDLLGGGDGTDFLLGGSGADVLRGGAGDDALADGSTARGDRPGTDQLFGDDGDDYLYVEPSSAALLDGGADADGCAGYAGASSGSGHYSRVDYRDCERATAYWASCIYSPMDGGAIEVNVLGGGAVVSLERNASGEVTVRVSEYDFTWRRTRDATYSLPVVPTPPLSCGGGGEANLATSVTVNGAGSFGWTDVLVHVENWTADTSITITDPDDPEVDDDDYLAFIGSDGADVIDLSDLGFQVAADGISYLWAFGNGGNDILTGGIPASVGHISYICSSVLGGAGDDVLLGSAGCEWMSGEPGDDRLEGGDGRDSLDGGSGNDVLRGGAGEDYLMYSGISYEGRGTGHDLLDGGEGESDHCDGYAGSPSGIRLFSGVTYEGCEEDEWWGGGATRAEPGVLPSKA